MSKQSTFIKARSDFQRFYGVRGIGMCRLPDLTAVDFEIVNSPTRQSRLLPQLHLLPIPTKGALKRVHDIRKVEYPVSSRVSSEETPGFLYPHGGRHDPCIAEAKPYLGCRSVSDDFRTASDLLHSEKRKIGWCGSQTCVMPKYFSSDRWFE